MSKNKNVSRLTYKIMSANIVGGNGEIIMKKIIDISIFGKYFKKMSLCNRAEKTYKCDNFILKLSNGIEINAIGNIDRDGFYFDILAVYNNGKIYRAKRFHSKYIATVRDGIFEYYKKEGRIKWLLETY